MFRLPRLLAGCALALCVATAAVAQTAGEARYRELRELIRDNLHFTAHLTWAVTLETIADLRNEVGPDDITVLVELLGDDDGKVRVAASGLLTTLGEPAIPALEAAKNSSDYRVSMAAADALIRLEECRTNPAGMNPDACPH